MSDILNSHYYYPEMTRQQAESYLQSCPIGKLGLFFIFLFV
jgi:hypothetical protein